MTDRYMMATKAETSQGQDISRDEPSLAIIYGAEDCCFVGEWATGIGFINVHFPRQTTRELTNEERQRYGSMEIEVGGFSRPIVFDEKGGSGA